MDMHKYYMKAMTLIQHFGKLDIFLTITCNSTWKEIYEELKPHEEAKNHLNLVSRVFYTKLIELKIYLFKREIFGKISTYVYVIKHQKGRVSHAYLDYVKQRLHTL